MTIAEYVGAGTGLAAAPEQKLLTARSPAEKGESTMRTRPTGSSLIISVAKH